MLVRDGGQVQLQASSLALSNGTRVEKAMVALETLEPGELDAARELPDDGGEQQAIEAVLGGLFVEPKTEDGQTLQLADDTPAVVDIPVAKGGAQTGDRMQLATVDEQHGTFKLEGSCTVHAINDDDDPPLVCRGAVSHFSTWSVTKVKKSSRPIACVSSDVGDFGGSGSSTSGVSPATVVSARTGPAISCRGRAEVRRSSTTLGQGLEGAGHARRQRHHARGVRAHRERKDPIFRNPDGSFQTVRYLTDYATLKLDGLGELEGDPNADSAACTLRIELPTKWKAVDEDGDGFFPEWDLPPTFRARGRDSGAWSTATISTTSSGPTAASSSATTSTTTAIPRRPTAAATCGWTRTRGTRKCKSACAIVEDEEIPGNLYDEDCDGRLADLDGDGADERTDCDDLNADAHPGGEEIAGNQTDEDCDGQFVDFDGDGHLFTRHGWLLSAEQQGDMIADDCNDSDSEVHGGRSAADEAGQLATFFTSDDTRLASFCGYFESDGSASSVFRYSFRDLDCDGHFTDLDGDGEDSPRDCDDTDPRVTPSGEGDATTCEVPDDLDNLAECKAEPAGTGDRCPVLFGGTRQSRCSPTLNSDGTESDIAVCNFLGWETSEPLVAEPGVAWGPCDGGAGILSECGDGLQCAGSGKPWSEGLRAKLGEWTEGAEVVFQGMCFPRCDL